MEKLETVETTKKSMPTCFAKKTLRKTLQKLRNIWIWQCLSSKLGPLLSTEDFLASNCVFQSVNFNFIQMWPKFVQERTCVKCVKTCDWLVNFLKHERITPQDKHCRHHVVRNRTWSDSQRLGYCQNSYSLFDELTRKPVQINTAGSPNGFKLEQAH